MNVRCLLDGRVYRVPRGSRRAFCPDVELATQYDLVRAVFEAQKLDRVDAMGQLSAVQRQILFPSRCACGGDHAKFAANLMRVHQGLSEAARRLAEAAELNLVELIGLAALQGDTPAETAERQLAAARSLIFGGATADRISGESIDESDAAAMSAA